MNAEQLLFLYNEVMGLFDWSEDDEAVGIDPLEFVRRELKRLRKNKPSLKTTEINRLKDVYEADLLALKIFKTEVGKAGMILPLWVSQRIDEVSQRIDELEDVLK